MTLPVPEAHDGVEPCYSFAQLTSDDTGLLWLINRACFHPRGYALALHYRADPATGGTDPNPVGWSILDSGDGTPWRYGEDLAEDEAYALVERLLAHARTHGRAPAAEDDPAR